eukprot:scaffold156355_cov36-Tisochrysis_lutea.AAC.3
MFGGSPKSAATAAAAPTTSALSPLHWDWATELREVLDEIKAKDASVDADIAALGQRLAARASTIHSTTKAHHSPTRTA